MTHASIHALESYPFQKLRTLLGGTIDPTAHNLSVGEPSFVPNPSLLEAMTEGLGQYPPIRGTQGLLDAMVDWLGTGCGLTHIDTKNVFPCPGTRNGLFALTQSIVDTTKAAPLAIIPNPFYQIYEGSALLAGAEPFYLDLERVDDLLAIPLSILERCQVFYLCHPQNPTGHVYSDAFLKALMQLALRHDFVIVCDECYIDIYHDAPVKSLLRIAEAEGNPSYTNCLSLQSLSKRSSLAGLRSGMIAGDASLIATYHKYATYCGASLPFPTQRVSERAWQDHTHVAANRERYQRNMLLAKNAFSQEGVTLSTPSATFYLWLETPVPAEDFALSLYREHRIVALPGSYLARNNSLDGKTPGTHRVRVALVASNEALATILPILAMHCAQRA